ncbi:hypothetical protein LTS18_000153, partial [Coniosporium uncinatum]
MAENRGTANGDSHNRSKSKSKPTALNTFFGGWGKTQPSGADSPTTTFSERSASPMPSPMPSPLYTKPLPDYPSTFSRNNDRLAPSALDINKANAPIQPTYPASPSMASTTFPPTAAQVEILKHELRDVGQELANSIRREIELEDELERLKFENQTNTDSNKRTSDYYSDSNASSTRFPIGDSDHRIEELERIRRKVEQDKAQQKAEMAQKLHDEMVKREEAERQVQELEEQLRRRHRDQSNGTGQNGRVKELESAHEDVRRKLSEEREARANFEDLFAALRGETEQLRNERDNLKEEVVPQLRAQIEGLEAGATDFQS